MERSLEMRDGHHWRSNRVFLRQIDSEIEQGDFGAFTTLFRVDVVITMPHETYVSQRGISQSLNVCSNHVLLSSAAS
jgi:hypothetical protein